MDSIEKGIVELIRQHGIRELVMGAAADKHYSRYKPLRNCFDVLNHVVNLVFCTSIVDLTR